MAGSRERKQTPPRVLVVGSANVDIVVPVPRLPTPGETVIGGSRKEFWGGKGANQAVAAQKAGATVRFLGALGKDPFGVSYRDYLIGMGLDRSGIQLVPEPTGTALIVVDRHGNNQIAVSPGANSSLGPKLLKKRMMEFGDVALAQLEVPISTVAEVFRSAKLRGAVTVLNPAPSPILIPSRLMTRVDVLVPNESEAAALCGERRKDRQPTELISLARKLFNKGVGSIVLTAGENGALIYTKEERAWVKPPPGIRVVDTTGAGDAFCGALATRLAERFSLMEAVRFAVAAGSLSVRKAGAQTGLPERSAIESAARRTSLQHQFAG